jgi:hypothetical protein
MVLEKQVVKLLLMAPLALVVVLDGIGLIGPSLRRGTLSASGNSD